MTRARQASGIPAPGGSSSSSRASATRIDVEVHEGEDVIDVEAWAARYVAACLEAEGVSVAPREPVRRIGS